MSEGQGDNVPTLPVEDSDKTQSNTKEAPSSNLDKPDRILLPTVKTTHSADDTSKVNNIRKEIAGIRDGDQDTEDTLVGSQTNTETDQSHDSGIAKEDEIERAKTGAKEFKDFFSKQTREVKNFLRTEKEGAKLQMMFLGIKPVSAVDYKYKQVMSDVVLPERFQRAGDLLYDRDLVEIAITANPDIFSDLSEYGENVESYMQALEGRKPIRHNATSEDTIKLGILLGFPRQSVLNFAKFAETRDLLMEDLRFGWRAFDTESERAIARNLANINENGEREMGANEAGKRDEYKSNHKEEFRDFLKKYDPAFREYIVNRRTVDVHGFNYADSSPEDGDPPFVRKISQIYDESGIGKVLKRPSLLSFLPFTR